MLENYNTDAFVKGVINYMCDVELDPNTTYIDVPHSFGNLLNKYSYDVDVFAKDCDATSEDPVKHTVTFKEVNFYDESGDTITLGFSIDDKLLDEYDKDDTDDYDPDIHVSYPVNRLSYAVLDNYKDDSDGYTKNIEEFETIESTFDLDGYLEHFK
jgi:hypothetical protein